MSNLPYDAEKDFTPPEVVARMNAAIQKALGSERLKGQFASSGNIPLPGSPQALDQLLKDERVAYAKLIKASGITVD